MAQIKIGDDLLIDSERQTVTKNGIKLALPDLSYRLLLTLADCAPEVAKRDDIIQVVWQGRAVAEENLKQRVTRLRGVIGDKSDEPQYIVAVRGVGYRLIARVERFEQPPEIMAKAITSGEGKIAKKPLLASLVAVFLLALAVTFFAFNRPRESIGGAYPRYIGRF